MFKSEGRLEGFIVSSWFIVEIMKLVEYRIAIKIIIEMVASSLFTRLLRAILLNETVFNSDDFLKSLELSDLGFELLMQISWLECEAT